MVIASLIIVLSLVQAAGLREVADTWRSIRWEGILVSLACYFAAIGVRILCWRRLLGADSPPARTLAAPLALGFVLGHVTPAKSGEPATALLVSRSFSLPLSRTLSVLTVERGLQVLVLLATFVPAATMYAGQVWQIQGTARIGAVLLAALGVGLVFATPWLRALARAAGRWPRVGPAASRYLLATAELLASRRRVIPILALVTIFWVLQYVSLWAILDAGGASVNLIDATVVAGAAIFGGTLSLLPLGTQDGISALVLSGLGVPLARGFALSLFHTLLSLAAGLVLVGLLPFWMPGTKKGAPPAPPS